MSYRGRLGLVSSLCLLAVCCAMIAGCTTSPVPGDSRSGSPASTTVEVTPAVTPETPAPPPPSATPHVTELVRTQASDAPFLLALDQSGERILAVLNGINDEMKKDTDTPGEAADYSALGSYSRRLKSAVDEEIASVSVFRDFSDPANEAKKEAYISYLTSLKPVAANIETGAGLAQFRDYTTAVSFFSNARNDLAVVRGQGSPGHSQVISQLRENLVPFINSLQQKAPAASNLTK